MRRDIEKLARQTYDLVIVGGGIYGASACWEAASRGLRVALVEKKDFGGATSANSAHIAHGGLRYLQHADLERMRQSIRERSTLMRIAPHLVCPQPFLMPTYGHSMKGPEVMRIALLLNDVISIDRKWLQDPDRRVPDARILSREETIKSAPGLRTEGLTGGAMWYDGQIRNTERLTLAFIRSAKQAGAEVVNYAEVTDFLYHNGTVLGVGIRDRETGERFDIRARMVLNAAGPWCGEILDLLPKKVVRFEYPLSKVFSLITRPITKEFALAVHVKPMYQDSLAIAKKGSQIVFSIPWRNHSIVGSLHLSYEGRPDQFRIEEAEIKDLINQVNEGYPAAQLKREDVLFIQSGIIPAAAEHSAEPEKHYHILDHETADGINGILTVVGVKYTTARAVSEKAVDLVFKKLDIPFRKSETSRLRLFGGSIERIGRYVTEEAFKQPAGLSSGLIEHLIENYGTAYTDIVRLIEENAGWGQTLSETTNILKAEIVYAIREEMALKLSDVVFRRTELGTLGHPGAEALQSAADVMAKELGWDYLKTEEELKHVESIFASEGARLHV